MACWFVGLLVLLLVCCCQFQRIETIANYLGIIAELHTLAFNLILIGYGKYRISGNWVNAISFYDENQTHNN